MEFQPKLIRSRPPVTVGGRILKRYDVTVTSEPIRDDVERSAWVRHIFGAAHPDLDAYLGDVLPDGPAGQPN